MQMGNGQVVGTNVRSAKEPFNLLLTGIIQIGLA